MLIRMRISARGVADGFTCREYLAAQTYDIADCLACHFVNRGYADVVDDAQAPLEAALPVGR